MKKVILGLLIFVVLAFITNPREAKHKEAVKRELNSGLEKEFGKIGEFLSVNFDLKGRAINTFIERENYFLYSKTILNLGPEKKVIGYGFFGFVIINKDLLRN